MREAFTLITGATSGFGRSTVEKLAPSRRLVLSDLDVEKLSVVRNACANSEQHLLWPRDLNQGVGEELALFLAKENICIEHFIHSAGVFGLQIPRAHDMAFVSRIFNVNLFSAIELLRTMTQRKINSGALRTVTIISSIGTRVGAPGQYVYAASKGAVNGFCLALAIELAPTVRVNTVLPSYIESGMNHDQFSQPDFVASIKAMHPLGLGRPEDVADAVEFLMSDRARWITGHELVVDGGRMVAKTLLPVK
ncbi:MAG TPA: SDR family oxidoreductase [Candidatus Saccharimonadales bacterium]|nr:SDR family oxidoreductase [Candidatus Saccharimonadales bacterium]